jgi:prephenate dehydratase
MNLIKINDKIKIFVLGPVGSFSLQGLDYFLENRKKLNDEFFSQINLQNIEIVKTESNRQSLELCSQNENSICFVPRINSIKGGVVETYETLLTLNNLLQINELLMPIEQYFGYNPNSKLDDIERIYSHPHAIGQCANWINNQNAERVKKNQKPLEIIQTSSTSGASKKAKEELNSGCICSHFAIQMNELNYLPSPIQDEKNNITNFGIFINKNSEELNNMSGYCNFQNSLNISFIVTMPNKSGELHFFTGILKDKAGNSINICDLYYFQGYQNQGCKFYFTLEIKTKDDLEMIFKELDSWVKQENNRSIEYKGLFSTLEMLI